MGKNDECRQFLYETVYFFFELLKNLLFTQMPDGVSTGSGAQLHPKRFVVDEVTDSSVEGSIVFGGDDDAAGFFRGASADDVGNLGAVVGGGDDGAAAGEDSGEFGRHDKIGGPCALWEEMDIGDVEEIIEPIKGLQGEQGDVGAAADEGFEPGTKGPIAAEDEVDPGIGIEAAWGEGLSQRRQEFEALFGTHVAGVEQDNFFFQTEFATEAVGSGLRLRVDGVDVDPVGKQDGAVCGNAFGDGPLDHLVRDAGDATEGMGKKFFEPQGEVVDETFGGKQA